MHDPGDVPQVVGAIFTKGIMSLVLFYDRAMAPAAGGATGFTVQNEGVTYRSTNGVLTGDLATLAVVDDGPGDSSDTLDYVAAPLYWAKSPSGVPARDENGFPVTVL